MIPHRAVGAHSVVESPTETTRPFPAGHSTSATSCRGPLTLTHDPTRSSGNLSETDPVSAMMTTTTAAIGTSVSNPTSMTTLALELPLLSQVCWRPRPLPERTPRRVGRGPRGSESKVETSRGARTREVSCPRSDRPPVARPDVQRPDAIQTARSARPCPANRSPQHRTSGTGRVQPATNLAMRRMPSSMSSSAIANENRA